MDIHAEIVVTVVDMHAQKGYRISPSEIFGDWVNPLRQMKYFLILMVAQLFCLIHQKVRTLFSKLHIKLTSLNERLMRLLVVMPS